jgi:ferrous iron transport protein A
MVPGGTTVTLVAVQAGRGLAQRLADMGFVPGVEIEVINNGAPGPIVVMVKGSQLVLGRGMAHKIAVQLLTGSTGSPHIP